ncbi:MAG: VTC domain-containing protein [Anaerolineae bacterium]|jgi:hypothetical protein
MMNKNGSTIRKFNRFELKYLINLQQVERFKADLQRYVVPDEHGQSNGHYTLSSLYYDSPDLRCYGENEQGLKSRRKLRIRRYETGEAFTDESPVFLEIKQRYDRITRKRRAVLPYHEALRLCNDCQIPDHEPGDKALIEEGYAFLWQYRLRPENIVRYDRQAFIGTDYDPGLRVTFNGGYLAIDANGDGIDANGSIEMTAGTVIVNGPTNDGNGPLDYLGTFNISGGYLVAVGSSGMAQAPSTTSTQYSVMYNFTSPQAAGTMVHIETESGQEVFTFTPAKLYQSVLLSSPGLENGSTYVVYSGGSSSGTAADGLFSGGAFTGGSQVSSFTITSMVTGESTGMGGFGGGGRRGRP